MAAIVREISEAAQAARAIKKEIKGLGLTAGVTSKTYSGGNSATVDLEDQPPGVIAQVEKLVGRYEAGHFDGMTDSYEFKSRLNDDDPQVMYAHVNNHYSEGLLDRAWTFMRSRYASAALLPAKRAELDPLARMGDDWADREMWRFLSGRMDGEGSDEFWRQESERV